MLASLIQCRNYGKRHVTSSEDGWADLVFTQFTGKMSSCPVMSRSLFIRPSQGVFFLFSLQFHLPQTWPCPATSSKPQWAGNTAEILKPASELTCKDLTTGTMFFCLFSVPNRSSSSRYCCHSRWNLARFRWNLARFKWNLARFRWTRTCSHFPCVVIFWTGLNSFFLAFIFKTLWE